MTDSVETIRPNNGTGTSHSGWASVGAGANSAVKLADDDASTYMLYGSTLVGTSNPAILRLTSFTLDDTDQIKYLNIWLTMTLTTSGDAVTVTARLYNLDGSKRLPDQPVSVVYPGLGRYDLLPYAGWADGSEFSADDLDALLLRFYVTSVDSTDVSHLFVKEAGVDITYNRAPTVTVATLSEEPFASYNNPQHTLVYTDPESDLQERYQDRIYQMPTAGWPSGADNDAVVEALEEAGEEPLFSEERLTDLTTTSRFVLPPTGLFRRYVRAADEGSGQRYGPWGVNAFTMNVASGIRPKAPTVAAGEYQDDALIELVIGTTGGGPSPDPDEFDIQRSQDGGTTWDTCIGSPVAYTAAGTTFRDRFAPREVALIYRVRSTRVQNSTTGDETASAWVSSSVITLTSDGNSWLQSPDDDDLDLAFTQPGAVFDLESAESQSVFYAEGRAEPIIYGGTVQLRRGTLTLVLTTDEQWETFRQLRALRGKLLLRTLYGEGPLVDVWVRLSNVGEQLEGGYSIMERGQLRQVTCPIFEVSPPDATW